MPLFSPRIFSSTSRLVRNITILSLVMVVALAAIAMSDPWKDKEYKSWTQDEVQRILFESPWVKMVEMEAPWLKGPTHYLTPLPSDCDGHPDMNRNDKTPTSWQLGGNESIVI